MDKVLRRFIVVYGEPKNVEPRELFAEFFAALANFRSDILGKAADRVIRDRIFPTWPTVGETVKACRDVADELDDKHIPQIPREAREHKPIDQEVAKDLLAKAHAGLDPRNSFVGIQARARAWASHHNCKVIIDVDAQWGCEVVDEHGRIVPIGWKVGVAA